MLIYLSMYWEGEDLGCSEKLHSVLWQKSADLASASRRKPAITHTKKVKKSVASGTACAAYIGNPSNWKTVCKKILILQCPLALGLTQPLTEMSKGKSVLLQAWSGPEGCRKLRSPDFMTMAQDGGKVSLMHRPPLPPGNAPGTHFCYRLGQPQGHSAIERILCQWKNPLTPGGIKPATFRFVAQQLNHCTTAIPNRNE